MVCSILVHKVTIGHVFRVGVAFYEEAWFIPAAGGGGMAISIVVVVCVMLCCVIVCVRAKRKRLRFKDNAPDGPSEFAFPKRKSTVL